MTIKTELNKTAENAGLAGQLVLDDPNQAKIWTILSIVAYSSIAYSAYRVTRGGVKLARKSK